MNKELSNVLQRSTIRRNDILTFIIAAYKNLYIKIKTRFINLVYNLFKQSANKIEKRQYHNAQRNDMYT